MRSYQTRSGTVTVEKVSDHERRVCLDGELAAQLLKGKDIFNESTGWRIKKAGEFVTYTGQDIELGCDSQREAILRMFEFRLCKKPEGVA